MRRITWYNKSIIDLKFRTWWFLFGFDDDGSRTRSPLVLTVSIITIPKCKATYHPQVGTLCCVRQGRLSEECDLKECCWFGSWCFLVHWCDSRFVCLGSSWSGKSTGSLIVRGSRLFFEATSNDPARMQRINHSQVRTFLSFVKHKFVPRRESSS